MKLTMTLWNEIANEVFYGYNEPVEVVRVPMRDEWIKIWGSTQANPKGYYQWIVCRVTWSFHEGVHHAAVHLVPHLT